MTFIMQSLQFDRRYSSLFFFKKKISPWGLGSKGLFPRVSSHFVPDGQCVWWKGINVIGRKARENESENKSTAKQMDSQREKAPQQGVGETWCDKRQSHAAKWMLIICRWCKRWNLLVKQTALSGKRKVLRLCLQFRRSSFLNITLWWCLTHTCKSTECAPPRTCMHTHTHTEIEHKSCW